MPVAAHMVFSAVARNGWDAGNLQIYLQRGALEDDDAKEFSVITAAGRAAIVARKFAGIRTRAH